MSRLGYSTCESCESEGFVNDPGQLPWCERCHGAHEQHLAIAGRLKPLADDLAAARGFGIHHRAAEALLAEVRAIIEEVAP